MVPGYPHHVPERSSHADSRKTAGTCPAEQEGCGLTVREGILRRSAPEYVRRADNIAGRRHRPRRPDQYVASVLALNELDESACSMPAFYPQSAGKPQTPATGDKASLQAAAPDRFRHLAAIELFLVRHRWVEPPSTVMLWPVMNADASDSRKSTGPSRSSGACGRLMHWAATRASF